jgi:hypothetical protein
MYYGLGGHGSYVDTTKKGVYLLEKDINTKKTRIIHQIDSRRCTELTGSGIIDSKGYVYFGGHGSSLAAEDAEAGAGAKPAAKRRAFIVKFNPKVLVEKYAKKYE